MQNQDSIQSGTVAPSRRKFLGTAVMAGIATVPVIGMMNSTAKAVYNSKGSAYDANAMQAFKDILKHENDHVAFLKSALGSKARAKPTFKNLVPSNFGDFYYAARIFEATGVGAYLGALPSISSKAYVAAAGSIALVEARHAGYLSVAGGHGVTTQADGSQPSFDKPLTQQQVVKAVSPYIVSLNGGPAPSYTAGDDISILNFALLLEYLEAEFYNLNVSKYV